MDKDIHNKLKDKKVKITYFLPTLGYPPIYSPQMVIIYDELEGLKAISKDEYYFNGSTRYVLKVERDK